MKFECLYRKVDIDNSCDSLRKREYRTGLLITTDTKKTFLHAGYTFISFGNHFTVKDAYGNEVKFSTDDTTYSLAEMTALLEDCACCAPDSDQVFSIESNQVTDNLDGTFDIDGVEPVKDALAFDEFGNVYGYDGGVWTLKVDGDTYWGDIGGTLSDQTDLWDILQDCCANGNKAYNISSTDVTDNGDGTFTLTVVDPATDGMAFDEFGNVYEFDGADWTLKHEAPTKLSQFANDSGYIKYNFFTINGTLTTGGQVNLNGKLLQFLQPNWPSVSIFQISPDGRVILSASSGGGIKYGFEADPVAGQFRITTGQTLTGLSSADNLYLKLIDDQGTVQYQQITVKEYASDTAADNDAALPSGAMYSVTGSKYVKTKGTGSNYIEPTYQVLTDAPIINWDSSLGKMAEVTLGGDRTLANPTNLKRGTYSLLVKNPGPNTLTFGSAYEWPNSTPPVIGSNKRTLLTFTSYGTTLYGESEEYDLDASVWTWDTTKAGSATDRIVLPLLSTGVYNFDVYYQGALLKTITTYTDNEVIFPDAPGVKEITIVGQLEGFAFSNTGDKEKIIRMDSFGSGFKVKSNQFCYGCSNLEYVGVLDVSGETTMSNMFANCSSLTTIDVSNWNVSNVTTMEGVFYSCSSLTTIDVSNWNTSQVTTMSNMFYNCSSLTTIGVSNWNTSQVTLMDYVFYNCSSLTTLDVSNWNVSQVTLMYRMLQGANLSTANYDLLLCGWSSRPIQPNVNFGAGTTKYTAPAKPCRDVFTNAGWTITDSGQV